MNFHPEFSIPLAEQNQVGVLLVNLGTPEAPTPEAVRPFLRDFLSDPRVIELSPWLWQPLLRGIILPFRSRHAARLYEKIWLKEGSPLKVFTHRQLEGLRERLPENIHCAYAMSYGKPSIHEAMSTLKSKGVGRIIVLPLYPQYAGSSTGAALDKVLDELEHERNQMSVRTVARFYFHTGYIRALAQQIASYRKQYGAGEKLMFSFHSIPQKHSDLGDPYAQECRETARLVALELGLSEQDYIVSFQSRFGGGKWLEPSTQTLFKELPRKHKITKLDVICPGFVSDCLETMEEIAIRGREQFHAAGGTQFQYIPCLNDNPAWLDALSDIVKESGAGWIKA